MAVKKVGTAPEITTRDPDLIRLAACRNCGAVLLYDHCDLETRFCPDGGCHYDVLPCPECGEEAAPRRLF